MADWIPDCAGIRQVRVAGALGNPEDVASVGRIKMGVLLGPAVLDTVLCPTDVAD